MADHPPLCPKTEEVFASLYGGTVACFGAVSDYPSTRRFIARYQACAWQDRAKRWLRFDTRWHAFAICDACLRNARAWREWESKNA